MVNTIKRFWYVQKAGMNRATIVDCITPVLNKSRQLLQSWPLGMTSFLRQWLRSCLWTNRSKTLDILGSKAIGLYDWGSWRSPFCLKMGLMTAVFQETGKHPTLKTNWKNDIAVWLVQLSSVWELCGRFLLDQGLSTAAGMIVKSALQPLRLV